MEFQLDRMEYTEYRGGPVREAIEQCVFHRYQVEHQTGLRQAEHRATHPSFGTSQGVPRISRPRPAEFARSVFMPPSSARILLKMRRSAGRPHTAWILMMLAHP